MLGFQSHSGPQAVRNLTNIIDRRQTGNQLGTGKRWENRLGRVGNQHQERRAILLERRQLLGVSGNQGIEITADDSSSLAGDAGSAGRVDDLSPRVQGSISTGLFQ